MSQSYVKECIFCKEKIRMSDQKEGKWLPYNEDGSQYDWKKKNGNGNGEEKKIEITLEMVQKKLESIGIIINVDRLMKQQNHRFPVIKTKKQDLGKICRSYSKGKLSTLSAYC
jgi:stress response protein SCP2